MGGNSNSPCASCKLLRRRCAKDCIFAPYFPSDDPHKFAMVHKVFGASNVSKMLQELPVHQRADAVSSIVYEANARMRDPVYGCVGAISYLQNQVSQLQMQLAVAQAEILCIQMQQQQEPAMSTPHHHHHQQLVVDDPSDDDKYSYFHHHNHHHDNNNNGNNNGELSAHHYLMNYPSSTSSTAIQESLKREPLFGHDHMVSS